MKATIVITAIVAAFLLGTSSAATEDEFTDKVVCYFGSWSGYRPGNGKFNVENINPKLCTHLIYSFVGIKSDGSVKVLDPWNDLEDNSGLGGFKRFVNLKKKAPGLKTLVAIGGWSGDGATFSKVVGSSSLRAKFVKNVVKFVQKYKFDGFDLDWEYPGDSDRGGRPQDVKNFSKLIKELRAAFDPHGLILTAAVAATKKAASKYYEVPQLSKYLDFINVMTYDLHGSWDGKTGINAPLNSNDQNNVKSCIEGWISLGANPKKLILGMGTYGRSFTLADSSKHGIGAKSTGAGKPGKYTGEAGTLGYNEIVELLKNGWTSKWDDGQKVPYAYKGNQWVGYDNEKSIKLKCDYAKKKGLGGGMIWSIDTDDFRGVSGKKYALLTTINKALGRNV